MKYDKETVLGVLEQIKEVQAGYCRSVALNSFLAMAKIGKYSTPTLEEVWKEKCDIAEKRSLWNFVFDFEGVFYKSQRSFVDGRWFKPEATPKL
jgi:hypothetical protein